MMSSSDKVAQLEAQLQKVKAEKAACKGAEKGVVEAKRITEEKAAAEVKQIAEEKVAAEAKHVEEWRQVELEERRRLMAAVKAQAEMEELEARAAARHKASLAVAETLAEEAETEEVFGSRAKQKRQAKGERLACDRCTTRGFDCQVSPVFYFLFVSVFSDGDGR